MFRVHAKFMMQGLYVLHTSTDLRGRLNGARPVERGAKVILLILKHEITHEVTRGNKTTVLILEIIKSWI